MFATLDTFGFAYYDVYLTDSGRPVAWIARVAANEPYTYSVFYSDGTRSISTTRGSAHNARNAVRSLVRQFKPS